MRDLKNLPKVELHCHLDGSIPEKVLKEFCVEKGIFAWEQEEQWKARIQAPGDCKSLTEYLKAFELPLACLDSEEAFFRAAYETAADAAKESVRYMEIRFAPLLSEREHLRAEAMIEAAWAGLRKAHRETGIEAFLILCGMRHFSEDQNQRTLELGKRYLGKGVCGLDLAGDESVFPNERFLEYFRKARKEEIPLTVHAGECGRKENIRLAAREGAGRIGHGIAAKGDGSLQEFLREKKIGVELCPSSNLQTKAVQSWEEYPLREFMKHGVLISVNTDNRTVTGTNLTRELELLRQHWSVSEKEMALFMKQAMETSFAEEGIKKKICQEIQSWEQK